MCFFGYHDCNFILFQIHLALYCYANSQITTALKLLYRARYLAVLICGENHPEIALLDVCISKIIYFISKPIVSILFTFIFIE